MLDFRIITAVFTLFIVQSCINNQNPNKVIIKELEPAREWRGATGMILVSKGLLSDTIFDCHYGVTPSYKLIELNDMQYLYTSCQMNGSGDNFYSMGVWSLEENNFLDTVFYRLVQVSDVYNSQDSLNINYWLLREPKLEFKNDHILLTIDSSLYRVNITRDSIIDTLSSGFRKLKFPLFN